MKISKLYGREVESCDGRRCGWVRAVLGLDGAPQFLQCFDEEEREFDVDIRSVKTFGQKIIFEDRESAKKQCSPIRLGLPAYGADGRFLGHLTDAGFCGGKIKYYIIARKRYLPVEVCAGDALIVSGGRRLKADVTDGKGGVVLKKGERLDEGALERAADAGEYFQAQLKTI